MAGISQDISIQVNNSLNRKATVTLLGGTQDPSNGQANAKTLYEWDLSAESFSNTTVVEIQASTVTNPEVITYTSGKSRWRNKKFRNCCKSFKHIKFRYI